MSHMTVVDLISQYVYNIFDIQLHVFISYFKVDIYNIAKYRNGLVVSKLLK